MESSPTHPTPQAQGSAPFSRRTTHPHPGGKSGERITETARTSHPKPPEAASLPAPPDAASRTRLPPAGHRQRDQPRPTPRPPRTTAPAPAQRLPHPHAPTGHPLPQRSALSMKGYPHPPDPWSRLSSRETVGRASKPSSHPPRPGATHNLRPPPPSSKGGTTRPTVKPHPNQH